jgi:hypothetical protein
MEIVLNLTEAKHRIKQFMKLLISMFVGSSSHKLHQSCCSVILYCIWMEEEGNCYNAASSV